MYDPALSLFLNAERQDQHYPDKNRFQDTKGFPIKNCRVCDSDVLNSIKYYRILALTSWYNFKLSDQAIKGLPLNPHIRDGLVFLDSALVAPSETGGTMN